MAKSTDLLIFMIGLSGVGSSFDCDAGLFGSQCKQVCGHCEGGPQFCQVYDGLCMNGCASGYYGDNCKSECKEGTHGQYCTEKCGNCSLMEPVCDRKTGLCKFGCVPGYQAPYCKTPCPYNTWGSKCAKHCKCNIPGKCGCDHVTGECTDCGPDGQPSVVYRKVLDNKCVNQFATVRTRQIYTPPNVLDFPFYPILSGMGLIAFFVTTNFLWWYIMVRKPKKKQVISVRRPSIPEWQTVEEMKADQWYQGWKEMMLDTREHSVTASSV